MDKSQINEIKTSIKNAYEAKIARLQKEMETALSALSAAEETLFANLPANNDFKTKGIPKIVPDTTTHQPLPNRTISIRKRVLNALTKVDGNFTSSQILGMVNNDSIGKKIERKYFAPEFTKLKKKGVIAVVTEPQGNQPGTYRKFNQKVQAESPALFEEEKGGSNHAR